MGSSSHLPLLLLFVLAVVAATPASGSSSSAIAKRLKLSNHIHHAAQPHPPAEHGDGPQVFFEVTNPLSLPSSPPSCSLLLLQHSFAYTYGLPPAVASYSPAPQCGLSWDRIVLRWSGACRGTQYDRIAAVWMSGVELLRTCTAEPTRRGVVWEVRKDVTRYASLFREPQLLVVELANIVDSTYTGIFHINLTLDFYPTTSHITPRAPDLVLPVSLPPSLSGGCWFQLSSEDEAGLSTLELPRNAYKAVLEIYVSFHDDDEFWYTNPPNEYITANNLTDYAGNGAFREVQAFVDGKLVGAVWPFPVIYTGGINPLYWRPAAAIGAFDLPSYEVELTPFLGSLVDGKSHTFSLKVKNALSYWLVNANLHLWLDPGAEQTSGGLLTYEAPSYSPKLVSAFKGLNGIFDITAERSISFSGYVQSSRGNLSTSASYSFKFSNVMVFEDNSDTQIVTQATKSKSKVITKRASQEVISQEVSTSFPLYLYCLQYEESSSYLIQDCNLTHAFNLEASAVSPTSNFSSSLKNSQQAQGEITVFNRNIITSAVGALQQQYDFESTEGCYRRSLSTCIYTILFDFSDESCINSS